MINLILFDDEVRNHLLPLVYTRPVAELRIGILSIREKWERVTGSKASHLTQKYLRSKYPLHTEEDNLLINGSALPSNDLLFSISRLEQGEAITCKGDLLATRLSDSQLEALLQEAPIDNFQGFEIDDSKFLKINKLWDLYRLNKEAIDYDFGLITNGKQSQPISSTNRVLGSSQVFIEEGAQVECATLNATTGPIYIGKNATIMEGAIVRGGLALCEGATLKMGAKIYGPTTVGPYSKIGGEVNNSIIQGYSNKGHDGFLGNSVLGEWCNLGADTNISNLKNNYAPVKLWSYVDKRFSPTDQQFCGLVMGDHSKCGINTMFNTGTVVGVSSNIFGSGFPRNFIPSFSWGGAQGFKTYNLEKACEVAEIVMKRRGVEFSEDDRAILQHVSEHSAEYRPK